MSADVTPFDPAPTGSVFFERRELDLILRVYGRMVAQAEWRDYAMVGGKEAAESRPQTNPRTAKRPPCRRGEEAERASRLEEASARRSP